MVPDEAEYQPGVGWVLSTLDQEGRRHGSWRRFTEDGSLAESTELVQDRRHGPSTLFHPNAEMAAMFRWLADGPPLSVAGQPKG